MRATTDVARGQLRAARAVYLPALRATIDARNMQDARRAAMELRQSLATITRCLDDARRGVDSAGLNGALDAIAELEAERDALLAEAEPVLAQAPAPAPAIPLLAPMAMHLDAAAPAGHDEQEQRTADDWGAALDEHAAVQRRASGGAPVGDAPRVAAAGVASGGAPLPHLDAIQRSFGSHDVSGISAHVGGDAAVAADAIGAEAYATGNRVAFASQPSLFVAAHEAAHVVQQRAGVSLLGGVGQAGDGYEQQADAVADRVVRGESAEELLGVGGRGVAGAAVQRLGIPDVGDAVSKGATEASVASEDEATKDRRSDLINNVVAQSAGVMDLLARGAANATEKLGKPPEQELTSALSMLLDLAAMTAIGAVAGYVATKATARISADVEQRTVADALKEGLKYALKGGYGAAKDKAGAKGDLLQEFKEAHILRLDQAKAAFIDRFWSETAGHLRKLHMDDLATCSAMTAEAAQNGEIMEAQDRQTAVEWINFLAQAKHGSMFWDPWAGEFGSPGAQPTDQAKPPTEAEPDPTGRNVSKWGVSDIMDNDQRPLQESHVGLLEIHLWVEGGEYSLYTHDSAKGMRLDNVHPYAIERLAEMGAVGNAPVNKIIRLYGPGQVLNPRPPFGAILVTADGYIRWGYDSETDQAAVRFAQSLSLEYLV